MLIRRGKRQNGELELTPALNKALPWPRRFRPISGCRSRSRQIEPARGSALGQHGVNTWSSKAFNAETQGMEQVSLPVVITVYADRFTFIKKTPPASVLKKAAGLKSGMPQHGKVGKVTNPGRRDYSSENA